jgi:glycosyltransferase involved in cell wall biosynthesis
MQERYPELAWQLTFRAWGQELEALQARATALGLTAVAFKRPLPKAELAQVMATADIGVVTVAPYPVLEANSANKFFDYLAAGLPVAINYEGWQAAYLQEFDAGRSAPQGDQDSFAEILAELIGAHELRARLRPNARRLAEQHFDRQTLARQALRRLRPAADSRT